MNADETAAITPPTAEQAAAALGRAAAHRQARYRGDPRYAHYTRAALAEQVVALPERPLCMGGRWWRVGVVLDLIGDEELLVRLEPATGRVQTAPIPRPVPNREAPPPPEGPEAEEMRRRWANWHE